MKQIDVNTLRQWQAGEKRFVLIDVREYWERELYHIGGMHLPMEEVMSRREEISREEPVVFYCEKGIRSQIIIQRLEELGYENLYNLTGGMKAWKETI